MRDILVHLKAHEEWSPHISYAIETARRFNSRLRALVTFHEVVLLRSLPSYVGQGLKDQMAKDSETARRLESKFLRACSEADVEGVFCAAEGAASEIVPWAARMHDLTIVEQRQPEEDELGYDAAEETALSAGRPVLLVPRHGHFHAMPEHILVAWNGSAMAASAVQGALPFIERAKKVTVCSGDMRRSFRQGSRVPDLQITQNLKRHVREVVEETTEVGTALIGEYLLDRANELGCEMIVMGAYGRSWFSEYVLGGATRHILKNMTVPILTGR